MCAQCDLEVVEFSLTLCLFAAEAYSNGFLSGVTRDMASIFGNDYSRRVAIDIVISLPSARQCSSTTFVFKRLASVAFFVHVAGGLPVPVARTLRGRVVQGPTGGPWNLLLCLWFAPLSFSLGA